MFLLRQPWNYDFVETEEGLLIIEKGEVSQLVEESNIIALNDIDDDSLKRLANHQYKTRPWTFMLDGMEHLYE